MGIRNVCKFAPSFFLSQHHQQFFKTNFFSKIGSFSLICQSWLLQTFHFTTFSKCNVGTFYECIKSHLYFFTAMHCNGVGGRVLHLGLHAYQCWCHNASLLVQSGLKIHIQCPIQTSGCLNPVCVWCWIMWNVDAQRRQKQHFHSSNSLFLFLLLLYHLWFNFIVILLCILAWTLRAFCVLKIISIK